MSTFFEGLPPITAEDMQASGIARELRERKEAGEVDFEFARYDRDALAEQWNEEGYGRKLAFVDVTGHKSIIVAQFEGESENDETTYRISINKITRQVAVPRELVPKSSALLGEGDYTLYDMTDELTCLEALAGDQSGDRLEVMTWLEENFGKTLESKLGARVATPYLLTERGVVGISVDAFHPFDEPDAYRQSPPRS